MMKERYRSMMEQVTLSDEVKFSILEKIEQEGNENAGMKRAVYWAAAAVAAAVLGIGGLILGTGAWPSGPGDPVAEVLPTPPHEEYDVLGDPDVLWGSGEDNAAESNYLRGGTVILSPRLEELMELADEDDLIAFQLDGYWGTAGEIDLNEMIIHEKLDNNGTLTQLISAYNTAQRENPDSAHLMRVEVIDYVQAFVEKNVWPITLQLEKMKAEMSDRILDGGNTPPIYVLDPLSGAYGAYLKELKDSLLADEAFNELYYGEFIYYADMLMEFYRTWHIQETTALRELFCQRGFIPIYQDEDLETIDSIEEFEDIELWLQFEQKTMWSILPNSGFSYKLFAFVGTAEQIRQLEDMIGEDEAYLLLTMAEPEPVVDQG